MPKVPTAPKALRAKTIAAPYSCNLCAEMNVTCFKELEGKATMACTRCYGRKKKCICFITLFSILNLIYY